MRDPKGDPSLFLEKCIPAVRATVRTDERSRSVRHDPEEISSASDKTCDGPTLAKSAGIDSVRADNETQSTGQHEEAGLPWG